MRFRVIALLLSAVVFLSCLVTTGLPAAADTGGETVLTVTHRTADRYISAGGSPVEAFSGGRLVLRGGVSPAQPMAGVQAFTVPAEDMGVTVVLEPPECELYDDYVNIVDGVSLTGSVRRGAVIVQKKYAAAGTYQTVAAAVDVFAQWTGSVPVYSVGSADVMKGVWLKVTAAYACGTGDAPARHLVSCEFYVGLSDDLVLIRDLANAQTNLPDTLTDGSYTAAGFMLQAAGGYCDASVSYNGGAWAAAADGQCFRKIGTYRIRTMTQTGNTRVRTVYVTPGGEAAAVFYFPDGQLLHSVHRIAAEGTYPVYDGPVQLRLNAVAGIPGLSGSVKNLSTDEVTVIDPHDTAARTITLKTSGRWYVRLTTGDENLPGTVSAFTFVFDIIPEGGTTNWLSLETPRSVGCYEAAHWEVVDSPGDGRTVHYVFASDHQADARGFAYRLLKARVTAVHGGWIFNYAFYADNMTLVAELNRLADLMVVRQVFDPRLTYPTTADSASPDVWVFPSEEERVWCVSRTRMIDPGFCFVYAEGESGTLTAESLTDGRVVPLMYGVPVGRQLSHGEWRITEKCRNGKRLETVVCVADHNTVRATVTDDRHTAVIAGQPSASVTAIGTARVTVSNPWDSEGVLEIIGADGTRTLCPLSGHGEQTFGPGHYRLVLADRFAHKVSIVLTVLPKPESTEAPTDSLTDAPAEPTAELPTEPQTKTTVEPLTELPTEPPAETVAEGTTETAAEAAAQAAAEASAGIPTEAPAGTYAETSSAAPSAEAFTGSLTGSSTGSLTGSPTEPTTEPTNEPMNEPTTEATPPASPDTGCRACLLPFPALLCFVSVGVLSGKRRKGMNHTARRH